MPLSPVHIEKDWFKDKHGRQVMLRGVNLGGDSKMPYPRGGTNYPTDFSDHRDVSFIGRPFSLDKADEHFSRLKAWGFNVVRLLTTWEAIEHKGPYDFDHLNGSADYRHLIAPGVLKPGNKNFSRLAAFRISLIYKRKKTLFPIKPHLQQCSLHIRDKWPEPAFHGPAAAINLGRSLLLVY